MAKNETGCRVVLRSAHALSHMAGVASWNVAPAGTVKTSFCDPQQQFASAVTSAVGSSMARPVGFKTTYIPARAVIRTKTRMMLPKCSVFIVSSWV